LAQTGQAEDARLNERDSSACALTQTTGWGHQRWRTIHWTTMN